MKYNTIILMAAAAIFCGCPTHHEGHTHDDSPDGHPASEEHQHHEGEIEISPERQDALGITTLKVSQGNFGGVIHTSGQILSAAGDEMTVVAPSEGIVILGNLAAGSPVGKGTRIATVSSKSLGTGDLLSKARISYETARKEYERDLQLSGENIVSESHLDKSRLEFEHAKAEYEALISGGVSEDGILVNSPLQGFIKNLMVGSGDFVQTGSPIATVSRNRRVRLRADVSEKYYGMIGSINDAVFSTSYSEKTFRLKELGGNVISFGRSSDGGPFIPVTFEFDNKGDFVPGSFVDVYLKTSAPVNGISVPLGAVVEDQGVHYVFVKDEDDDDAFLRREVRLGPSDGMEVLVESGLEEGEEVVVTGAVHVKLAGVTAVPAGHTHNH